MKLTHDFPTLKEKILFLLGEEPNLSTDHLIALTGARKNTVQKALNRLVKNNLIKGERHQMWTSYFWRMKKSKRLNESNFRHESACADIYTALRSTGEDMLWISKDDQKKGFRFDRAFKMFNRTFFIELETGTHFDHRFEVIPKKVESYMKLDGWFHTIFVVMDYDQRITAKRYGMEILGILKDYNRHAQFLLTSHRLFSSNPLGEYLVDPFNGKYSLSTLPSPVNSDSIRVTV